MSNITDLNEEQKLTPILRLGFRPFFFLGSAFALVSMLIWVLALQGNSVISPFSNLQWWHSHEMLFGFVPAIVSGFLLTAVQTWTGIPSVKGRKLLFLVALWLSARVLLILNLHFPLIFVALIDLAFLPATGYFLAKPLIKIAQYRNLVFVPIIALMTIANTLTYLPQFGFDEHYAAQGFHAMVLLTTLLVALIGGRVIPMFTANGTKTTKVLPLKYLEWGAMGGLVSLSILLITGWIKQPLVLASLCFVTACLHLYRNLRWRPWVTFRVPLVWVLHCTMLFIPIGLFMMAVHFAFNTVSFSAALHSLTVGVIGGMIMAMTSRVSLGHTGRVLQVSNIMAVAFVSVILAAICRGLLVALLPQYVVHLWQISGALWCLSFAFFLWVYTPILFAPRVDGRPG